jgi:hypothetical protein
VEAEFREFAIAGLEAEIARLQQLRQTLLDGSEGRRETTLTGPAVVSADRQRRRGGMSAAQRKAVSKRMKAYWAAKRKG